ncbi:MAG: hypothetical protein R3C09_18795 [Pirellulaceae bacterium]
MKCCTHRQEGYEAADESILGRVTDVASTTKALRGCKLGFFGVLHTWGRDPMVYHPRTLRRSSGGVELDKSGKPTA